MERPPLRPEDPTGYTLIVWECPPDLVRLYMVPNSILADDEIHAMFARVQGRLLLTASEPPSAELDAVNTFRAALTPPGAHADSLCKLGRIDPGWAGVFSEYLCPRGALIAGNITAVYNCGFTF